MRIVIINRTNRPQTIRKSNGDIVTINAYSPFILETNFKPEINFWTNCVDERFIVTDKISDLNRLVASLPKNVVKAQKKLIEEDSKITIENNTTKEIGATKEKEVVIAKSISNDTISDDNNNIDKVVENEAIQTLKTAYETAKAEKVENLSNLTVKNLRILAEKMGIEIPNNTKKADIVKLIENAENSAT